MARQIGRIRAAFECGGIGILWGTLAALPLERAVRLGARVGVLAAQLDRFNRPIGIRNLEIAFPELEARARREILRTAYANWGRMLAEWVHSKELNPHNVARFVTYEGWENLEEAAGCSDGRGILVLTGHYGNFEWLSLAHSIYGHPLMIVQRPLRNPILASAVGAVRTRYGNQTVARKGAARAVLRFLRGNGMVAVPLDLDVRHGVFVDFFSVKASTSDGLARMAMVSGAPVLPAFMVRQGTSTHHHITILPRIDVVRTRDSEESVRENTQRFTAAIEMMVRRHPDHWNWIHRRWKTRPPGEARFY